MKKTRTLVTLLFFAFCLMLNAQTSSNEKAAREWIAAHSKELKVRTTDNFKLSFVRKSLSGETLRFQQIVNEVPVFQSEIVVHFNPNNEITNTSNSYFDKNTAINTTPSITEERAKTISNEALKEKIIDGFSYQASKLFVNSQLESSKLVYRVVTNPKSGSGSWEVMIDAQTGQVISITDVAFYHHKEKGLKNSKKLQKKEAVRSNYAPLAFVSGTALVYNPSPLAQAHVAYGGDYSSPPFGDYPNDTDATNPSLDAARTSVVLPEIDLTDGVYKLKSSYVEIMDIESPYKGLFTQATNSFSFDRSQDGFEAVNAFYHLDKSMRYINETLGIDCRPSLNSGILFFDPSGLSGDDNAHYVAESKYISYGEGGVDDAEDAEVVLHEFGHGVHDWLTAGSVSRYIGEGNGDYWAMSYSRSLNQWATTDTAYNWLYIWEAHNEWWSGRITNYTPNYPSGLVGTQSGSSHIDGQIWATALMKIWDAIGKTKTDKAFLEGLTLTHSFSNQNDAAVAFRQVAIDMNYSCADITTITSKLESKGYTLPDLPLTMAPIADQTVAADANNTYTLPSYATLANPIVASCNATLAQTPAIGSVRSPGTYQITMDATSDSSSVQRTFNLTITPHSLSNTENVKQSIVIYPNPAKNQITIKGEFDTAESITIYNLLGQTVLEKATIANEEKVDVSKLSNGVYTIYFHNSKASYKFVKE